MWHYFTLLNLYFTESVVAMLCYIKIYRKSGLMDIFSSGNCICFELWMTYFTSVKLEDVTNPYLRPRLSRDVLEGIRSGLVMDCC